jgi:galactokinase
MMDQQERVTQSYIKKFGEEPQYIALAPGRVNILGEHVDYNEGYVLPAAIDRVTTIAFSRAVSSADLSIVLAADFNQKACFTRESLKDKNDPSGEKLPDWALYPAGVAWSMSDAGLEVPAMNAVFASDVPRGAGLSSSASVEMAFGIAWSTLGGWTLPPMQLARLGQRAENLYVGVNCGIMDQFASACGVADRLLLLDCRSLNWRSLPIPENISIVIADTSVRRKLTSSGYNERRHACEDAVRILSSELMGIKSLRDVNLEDFNRLSHKIPVVIEKRARHVVEEIDRTSRAVPMLENGLIREFGQMMNDCHTSLRDLFEVSVPELDKMVEIAQGLPGCYGARLTGAGFGGCTVNLVEKSAAEEFSTKLAWNYQKSTGLRSQTYICRSSDGARLTRI